MTLQDHNTDSDANEMTTLSACMTKVVQQGYTDNFQIDEGKLYSPTKDAYYEPEQVHIDNFYRFEGVSDPADMAVLYAIQTQDGIKGMLVDAYGTYGDEELQKFIKEVQDIHKKDAEQNR